MIVQPHLTLSKNPPGDLAMWIFIVAELLVFALFFASYAFTRANHVELFNSYQPTLNQELALLNTLALISGSYCVVRALAEMRENHPLLTQRWLFAAVFTGVIFILIKSLEYRHHYANGINLRSNLFYMFYFSLTFFHFMHVIMAMIILLANAFKTRAGQYSPSNMTGLETGASYWHMVDLVWIILFPLVYVMH
jgi:nitric oxide reductase NorE protein